MEILSPRDVPLGGPRAMTVRRTLPQRQRSLIGAWCFVDHYGPDDLAEAEPMVLPPHPHTGLSTVSWLFAGTIEHRDSAGHRATVSPGALNLMTAGRGISHSEYSTPDAAVLHGCQLWIALPEHSRDTEPDFEHHRPEPVRGEGWTARVFIGALLGCTSPVRVHSPLVGAELALEDGARLSLPVDPAHEHGFLVDRGRLLVDGGPVAANELGYVGTGSSALALEAVGATRLMVIGGEPLGEEIVMWWNFIGRDHDDIAGYRADWQRLLDGGSSERFTLPVDDPLPPLPAPALPNARLRPRS
ncbi:pirin family protein [Nocardioides terrisoli]|uniref:pirin family protein n=1 Tax=Nocardioides terrisoli TaxID=3388267 RepID=UPI00287B98F1|nr:pirin family protein [Nocardioides marmorisolisilvae]